MIAQAGFLSIFFLPGSEKGGPRNARFLHCYRQGQNHSQFKDFRTRYFVQDDKRNSSREPQLPEVDIIGRLDKGRANLVFNPNNVFIMVNDHGEGSLFCSLG